MYLTNKISSLFYKFATKEFSPTIQSFINNSYVEILGLDMSEFDKPSNYKSLNQLFTRALKNKRDFDQTNQTFISPTDSFVTQCGTMKATTSYQIKGMKYDIQDLLTDHTPNEDIQKLSNGTYCNLYLSPKDYHRYHMPYDAKILKLIYVPGKLYPVNFTYLQKKSNLFIENERVILKCQTENNKIFYLVFVGALNVGKMVFEFEPSVETNNNTASIQTYQYDDLSIKKGDCLGYFKMGSTVLVFWEQNMVKLNNIINKKVKFGDTIAKLI
jgi:phosphatidylserine decarboxylase